MGCKESKHRAVAEGNTIITPSSSRKSMSRGQSSSIKNNAASLQRSRSTRSSVQKQDSLKKINVGDSKASTVLKQNENAGYDKGTVNVSRVLEGEDRRLKDLNDQIAKSEEKELMTGKNDVGIETNVERKENENVEKANQEKDKLDNVVIPKVNLSSSSRKDDEGIESVITDGLSARSVYFTPTEAHGPFGVNRKTDDDEEDQELIEEKQESSKQKQESNEEKQESTEEKQESIEEIKDTESAEGAAEDNTNRTVHEVAENDADEAEVAEKNPIESDAATPRNQEESEVSEKIKVAEAAEKNPIETDAATPGNQDELEVAEKLKVAEDAISALETMVKEGDKTEDNDEARQDPVEETEEVPVSEGKIAEATLEKPVIEADDSDMIRQTEVESTDATHQNPEQGADRSEESREIEPEATDATLSYPVIESDKTEESLLKDENGVKEIHEVADKVEEIPPEEADSSDPTDHKNQELVSDKTEDVQGKEAEVADGTQEDPVKEVGVADQVENLGTDAKEISINEENPVKNLENTTKDEANAEEDTENSSTANVHQISSKDPDNK
ncbi:hypothetical protein DCAR_0935488 [Daucus carota subsp. sativus]|uniref:Uncharacterized protein n=1 Tax=Daucus carota subsp. sativus TaxID=79200 RepID=A0A175YHW3_DAUCS|nr:hypothetical protein DCAR_0935488 [Daucus carota subsp. sativus]